MATLTDILTQERKRTEISHFRQVYLYPDGGFYRAYEYSAWLSTRFIYQFNATKKMVKAVGGPMVFVGFPQTSLQKFVPDGAVVFTEDPTHVRLELSESCLAAFETLESLSEEFQKWKDTLPLRETKSRNLPANNMQAFASMVKEVGNFVGVEDLLDRLRSFPIAQRTPIDCMIFLSEIQQQLLTIKK